MSRTIKKQPKTDRPKRLKPENGKRSAFKKNYYDYSEDENE
jgi:hypothetical protein